MSPLIKITGQEKMFFIIFTMSLFLFLIISFLSAHLLLSSIDCLMLSMQGKISTGDILFYFFCLIFPRNCI